MLFLKPHGEGTGTMNQVGVSLQCMPGDFSLGSHSAPQLWRDAYLGEREGHSISQKNSIKPAFPRILHCTECVSRQIMWMLCSSQSNKTVKWDKKKKKISSCYHSATYRIIPLDSTHRKSKHSFHFLLFKSFKSWWSFYQKPLSSNDWVYFPLFSVLSLRTVF